MQQAVTPIWPLLLIGRNNEYLAYRVRLIWNVVV